MVCPAIFNNWSFRHGQADFADLPEDLADARHSAWLTVERSKRQQHAGGPSQRSNLANRDIAGGAPWRG
jgi:hypothetical protein